MEILKIEILNPKAKSILKGLADLKLINIKRENKKSDFKSLLDKLRDHAESAPGIDDVAKEVELVRKQRYEE